MMQREEQAAPQKTNRAEPNGYEQILLKEFPKEVWPFELAFLRTKKRLKWDGFAAARNKESFRHGWNCAIAMESEDMVLTEQEKASIREHGVIK
jgi:hypothetical protein